MKARCKHRGRPGAQSSRLARREMNHLNQKVPAQNGATSSGPLHGRGNPIEEDNSKGHCRQGGSGGEIPADTRLLRRTAKLKRFFSPSELQQEWTADQVGQRKRGRKPKVAPGVKSKGPQYKDDRPSERRKATEERSDSESSEHGEFWFARASLRVKSSCHTFIL